MARQEQYYKLRLKKYGVWITYSTRYDNYSVVVEQGKRMVQYYGYEDYEIIKDN